MKKTITSVVILIIILAVIYFIGKSPSQPLPQDVNTATTTDSTIVDATSTANIILTDGAVSIIGKSVEGRNINAYHYGTGTSTELLFIGGIHGGYGWNTALVAYELTNYLKANPSVIPSNVKVTVIPVLNPDGLNKVVGTTTGNFTLANVSSDDNIVVSGRFNGNSVDLNRNFDCDWQATGKWQNTSVSGGSAAFSEPESQAIKNYIETNKPTAVIVWYSAAGGVFASNCHSGVLDETTALTKAYATGSGYSRHESFDFYSTTGDMTNWLAKIGTPAISILLTNHTDTEWSKNQAGILSLFKYYAK